MKALYILLTFVTVINPMNNQHIVSPKPSRAHQLHAQRLTSQLPLDLIVRPDTPHPNRSATPPRLDYAVNVSPFSPEAIQVEEIRARAIEVRSISKKKIACFVAASSIISALLTASVTLTIHFTDCKK